MKSKNFVSRSDKTNLRGNREKKVEKQKNWDRIVYLIFLALLVAVFGYFFIKKFLFVEGKGFFVVKNMQVRAPDDLRLSNFFVYSNDSICQNEKLFSFVNAGDEETLLLNELKLELEENLDPLKNKSFLIRKEIAVLQEKLSFHQTKENSIANKIRLDIATLNDLDRVQGKILDINAKIKVLRAEISALYTEMENHKNHYQTKIAHANNTLGNVLDTTSFYSPKEGVIDELFVSENEMVFESEPIMSIRVKDAETYVVVKFDRDDAPYLLPGTILNIEFANGKKSKGIIHKNYVPKDNYRVPDNRYKRKIEGLIVVNLFPINEEAKEAWKNYRGKSVEAWRSIF